MLAFFNDADRHELCRVRGIGGGTADVILRTRPYRDEDHIRESLGDRLMAKLQGGFTKQTDRGLSLTEEGRCRKAPRKAGGGDSGRVAKVTRIPITTVDYESTLSLGRCMGKDYYSEIGPRPTIGELHRLVSCGVRFGARRSVLFPVADRRPDGSLRCVYTDTLLCKPGSDEYEEKCDEEHSTPQSWQDGSGAHTGRDMHQMFAASKHSNGSRGNVPYGIPPDAVKEEGTPSGTYYYGGTGEVGFVPLHSRGAVARAALYILTMYKYGISARYLPAWSVQWLVDTASTTPVSPWEEHRNAVTHCHQGNRNPFIDHPEWVAVIGVPSFLSHLRR